MYVEYESCGENVRVSLHESETNRLIATFVESKDVAASFLDNWKGDARNMSPAMTQVEPEKTDATGSFDDKVDERNYMSGDGGSGDAP